ncbi:hypothetical protein HQ544_05000 [Candidatus Falkowbacteria bacterium]|nr:hypothetical protein [Candidatus Falkowbacteria bacterium]
MGRTFSVVSAVFAVLAVFVFASPIFGVDGENDFVLTTVGGDDSVSIIKFVPEDSTYVPGGGFVSADSSDTVGIAGAGCPISRGLNSPPPSYVYERQVEAPFIKAHLANPSPDAKLYFVTTRLGGLGSLENIREIVYLDENDFQIGTAKMLVGSEAESDGIYMPPWSERDIMATANMAATLIAGEQLRLDIVRLGIDEKSNQFEWCLPIVGNTMSTNVLHDIGHIELRQLVVDKGFIAPGHSVRALSVELEAYVRDNYPSRLEIQVIGGGVRNIRNVNVFQVLPSGEEQHLTGLYDIDPVEDNIRLYMDCSFATPVGEAVQLDFHLLTFDGGAVPMSLISFRLMKIRADNFGIKVPSHGLPAGELWTIGAGLVRISVAPNDAGKLDVPAGGLVMLGSWNGEIIGQDATWEQINIGLVLNPSGESENDIIMRDCAIYIDGSCMTKQFDVSAPLYVGQIRHLFYHDSMNTPIGNRVLEFWGRPAVDWFEPGDIIVTAIELNGTTKIVAKSTGHPMRIEPNLRVVANPRTIVDPPVPPSHWISIPTDVSASPNTTVRIPVSADNLDIWGGVFKVDSPWRYAVAQPDTQDIEGTPEDTTSVSANGGGGSIIPKDLHVWWDANGEIFGSTATMYAGRLIVRFEAHGSSSMGKVGDICILLPSEPGDFATDWDYDVRVSQNVNGVGDGRTEIHSQYPFTVTINPSVFNASTDNQLAYVTVTGDGGPYNFSTAPVGLGIIRGTTNPDEYQLGLDLGVWPYEVVRMRCVLITSSGEDNEQEENRTTFDVRAIPGDLNMNGVVSITDAGQLLSLLLEQDIGIPMSQSQFILYQWTVANFRRDAYIDGWDYQSLMRDILGLPPLPFDPPLGKVVEGEEIDKELFRE